jgi:hypothetical protein
MGSLNRTDKRTPLAADRMTSTLSSRLNDASGAPAATLSPTSIEAERNSAPSSSGGRRSVVGTGGEYRDLPVIEKIT